MKIGQEKDFVNENTKGGRRRSTTPVLLIVFLILTVLLVVTAAAMAEVEYARVYEMPQSMAEKEEMDYLLRKYSIYALSDWQKDFRISELKDSNFRYGIIQTSDISGIDLTDPSVYLVSNLEPGFDPTRLQQYSCTISSNTEFRYSISLASHYADHIDSNSFIYGETGEGSWVESILYNRNTDCIYIVVTNTWTGERELHPYKGTYQLVGENPADGTYYVEVSELGGAHENDPELRVGIYPYTEAEMSAKTSDSFAVGYENSYEKAGLRDMLSTDGSEWQDKYQAVKLVLDNNGREDVMIAPLREVPITNNRGIQVYGKVCDEQVVFFRNGYAYLKIGDYAKQANAKDYYVVSYVRNPILDNADLFAKMDAIIQTAYNLRFAVLAIAVLFLLVYGAVGIILLVRFVMWSILAFVRVLHVYRESLPAFVRGLVFLFCWGILGMMLMLLFYGYGGGRSVMVFWVLEKFILFQVLLFLFMQINRLRRGSQSIADGDMDTRIDTRYMMWDMKKIAENINDIGSGINHAVEERMRSERFKTELITNVSHDIKTPLTSIVSYVELLQKEEWRSERAAGYLEILGNQSARLKKLIEDLIEASKASTGNLACSLQRCDVNMILTQMLGEYEEKLLEHQIQLVTRAPEDSIDIRIDQQHFPRVIDNLMNNIYKYAQPGTRAYVTLEKGIASTGGEEAVITFRNTSNAQLNISSDELLQRFARGDASRNTEGNGLGLNIAQSLTELMGGSLELTIDGDLFKIQIRFSVIV